MSHRYDILLTDEVEGADLDLDTPVTPTDEESAVLRGLKPEDTRGHTTHRLGNDWQGYRAGTLVLYDGQEVLLFLK